MLSCRLAFSRTPSWRGLWSGWVGRGRGGGLSFCVSWSTLASDRPRHFGENPSQEPVPLRLSVQDLSEPSLAQVVGWGAPGAGESSTVPAFPHLSSAFTSLLVIWRLLSYCSITKQNTCVWGVGRGREGVTQEREGGWGLRPARPHCPTLALWIPRTLMCFGMGEERSLRCR